MFSNDKTNDLKKKWQPLATNGKRNLYKEKKRNKNVKKQETKEENKYRNH